MKVHLNYTTKRNNEMYSMADHFIWSSKENFSNLVNKQFNLFKMTAADIIEIEGFSDYDKIILSAVAGAAFQYIIDNNMEYGMSTCLFTIGDD